MTIAEKEGRLPVLHTHILNTFFFFFFFFLFFFLPTAEINPFSASPVFGQVQRFFSRKFIGSFVFMLESYISREFFFFIKKTLKFLFR